MKRHLTAILCILCIPLGILSYVASIIWILIWIGWKDGEEFMLTESTRRTLSRSNVDKADE